MVTCIADLLGAGLDTTSISITWGIFYLASFPEVQTKLQKEIDEVIPKGTLISLEHKSRYKLFHYIFYFIIKKYNRSSNNNKS